MIAYLLFGSQHIWIIAAGAFLTIGLFMSVIVIALLRRYNIKASGWYGALGFSLEAQNNDGPKARG